MAETAEDIIAKMAKMPCPLGGGNYVGSPFDGTISWEGCTACKGTGARFHWLREDCSDCRSSLTRRPTGRVNPDWRDSPPCNLCHGTGWVPHFDIPLEEALAELEPRHRGDVLTYLHPRLWAAGMDTASDIRWAFWQAVEKAVTDV